MDESKVNRSSAAHESQENVTGKGSQGPVKSQIRDLKDVLVGELARRGNWVVANVETDSFWPINTQKQGFRGQTIWILPLTNQCHPAIGMQTGSGFDRARCEHLLMQFLTTLSWVTERGITVIGFGGGTFPTPMGRDKTWGFSTTDDFDLSYFPEPTNEKALLALALMREGRGLNHPGYAFLSFYRVLEVAVPDGRARGEWITNHLDRLSDPRARGALANLSVQGVTDVGTHLRDSGRRAMAHAQKEPIINPDNPADADRLWAELPIMSSLAILAIEEVFEVETSHTVFQKHLYELAGFKSILWADPLARITRTDLLAYIPQINVRLRSHAPFAALENLIPIEVYYDKNILFMCFQSKDGNVIFQCGLNFEIERLQFEVFSDLAAHDSGTADGALTMLSYKRFFNGYFCNGQLEIYASKTGALLSRKDPFLPVNIMFNPDAAKAELAQWEQLAEKRRTEESGADA